MAANRRQNDVPADGALLDATNRRLLAELQSAARLRLAELGRRVGPSSPAVGERVQRLERDGVILAHVRSVEHLEELVDRFTPYGQTTTSIVQSSPVAPRGLDLGDARGAPPRA